MVQVLNSKVIGICLVLICLQIVNAKENACLSWEFKCDDGQCVNENLKCNSIKDCSDGSDETFAECYDVQCDDKRCRYGGCVPESKWCNGVKDCWDGTDENEYDCGNAFEFDRKIRGNCTEELFAQFQCVHSHECILHSKLCDGIENCRDKSDESLEICMTSLCPSGSFNCAYGACISESAACNHEIDCRDGSDEISSICKKMKHLSANDIWYLNPWEIQPSDHAVTPSSSTPKPPSSEKSCRLTDPELRVRVLYNGMPYFNSGTVSHFTTVRLSCTAKYAIVGSDVNTCDDGDWRVPLAECVKVCDSSVFTNDRSIVAICRYNNDIIDCATEPLKVSTRAAVSCAKGYYSASPITQAERVCTRKGTWAKVNKEKLICMPDCGRIFETVKEVPWLVSVFERMPYNEYEFRCLGAIVNQFHVLTVASCFQSSLNSPTSYSILLGNQTIGFNLNEEHGYEVRNIAKIDVNILKPLALVRLINPLVLSAKLRPICLQNITTTAPATKSHTLGEPVATFINATMKYSLTHISDTNSIIDIMSFLEQIKDQLKQ